MHLSVLGKKQKQNLEQIARVEHPNRIISRLFSYFVNNGQIPEKAESVKININFATLRLKLHLSNAASVVMSPGAGFLAKSDSYCLHFKEDKMFFGVILGVSMNSCIEWRLFP